jgi:hypothetical protein
MALSVPLREHTRKETACINKVASSSLLESGQHLLSTYTSLIEPDIYRANVNVPKVFG